MFGKIKRVIENKGFGFIEVNGGNSKDLFMHCKQLPPGTKFDSSLVGREVQFDEESSDKGQRAVKISFSDEFGVE